jgi:hypothetical protein
MARHLKVRYNLLVKWKGELMIMSKSEYLKALRECNDCPKMIGKIIPTDKTDLEVEEVKVKKVTKVIYCKTFTHDHLNQLRNLIHSNADFLANKGKNNFFRNFEEVIINKIKKPFEIKR